MVENTSMILKEVRESHKSKPSCCGKYFQNKPEITLVV